MQIARAVAVLHNRGIVHGAIMPANIICLDGCIKLTGLDHATCSATNTAGFRWGNELLPSLIAAAVSPNLQLRASAQHHYHLTSQLQRRSLPHLLAPSARQLSSALPTAAQDLQALGLLTISHVLGVGFMNTCTSHDYESWAACLGDRIMVNIGSFSAGAWQPDDINTAIVLALLTLPREARDSLAWQRLSRLNASPAGRVAKAALVVAAACVCSGTPGHPTTTPTAVWQQLTQLLNDIPAPHVCSTLVHLDGALWPLYASHQPSGPNRDSTSPTERTARTSGGRQVSAARVCRAASMPNATAPTGCDHRQPPLLVKSISTPASGEGRAAAPRTGKRSGPGAGRKLSGGRCKA
jgi:hypothetical protein